MKGPEVGLLTGHKTLNWHLTLLKINKDPVCSLCGEEYDACLHLLGRCSSVGETKKTVLKTFVSSK